MSRGADKAPEARHVLGTEVVRIAPLRVRRLVQAGVALLRDKGACDELSEEVGADAVKACLLITPKQKKFVFIGSGMVLQPAATSYHEQSRSY